MRPMAVTLLLMLAASAAASAQTPASDTWLDATSERLVRAARERRTLTDRRIQRYQADALERMSVGLRAGIGERLLFRRETASRIDWTHDTVRIEVLGAREVVPPVKGAPQVPAGLSRYVPGIAFDPVDSEMLLRIDSSSIRHPLADGSEQHYRFRTGDSTVITLPNGRVVRLRELQFLPRRRDPSLITGSFWLDTDTHAVVQAYFRLARAYDADLDEDDPDVPFFLKPMRAELDYVAIDYGLWDLHWWLPRTLAARGLFQAGSLRLPLSFERRYDNYFVQGDTLAPPPPPGSAVLQRPCRPPIAITVRVSTGSPARDTAAAAPRDTVISPTPRDSSVTCDRAFVVTRGTDDELLASDALPESGIYDDGTLIDSDELRRIAARVRAIPDAAWSVSRPVFQVGPTGPGLLRYNRVEGLAIGARAMLDAGPFAASAELHVATAEPDATGTLRLLRRGRILESGIAAYRRLDAVDISSRPLTFGSSLGALLLGRDDNDYFRASGAELTLRAAETQTQWFDLRLFVEAQRAVSVHTDFNVPHLFDEDRVFRPNVAADRADQAGAALRLRLSRGLDPLGFRWGGEAELHAETGDYQLVRPSLRLHAALPITRSLSLATEAAAGTAFGDVTAQRLWQLGGTATLRGYDAGILRGDTYWRARTELGLGMAFARFSIFGDAAWAGERGNAGDSRPLKSAGAGVALLDGLVRIDVARALNAPRDWRLHLRVGGM